MITHPFHPLHGQEFELVSYRHNWGEDKVYYYDHSSRLISIPARCTSVAPEDPFVRISAGRSFFRIEDLIHLCTLIENLKRDLNQNG